jgi:hypothetical protein
VKFLRFLLQCLALAIVLVVILVVAAFAPVMQTWVAQMVLDRQPALHGSLESLSAGIGRFEIGNLRLKVDGALLTVPSLQAELPLVTAGWNRRFLVKRLLAKGWTLDLRQNPEPNGTTEPVVSAAGAQGAPAALAPPETVAVQNVVRIFRGTLRRWALPCDLSLDGVELEGDVLVDAPAGMAPLRIHVIVKGGGMVAGRDGIFAIDASSMALDPGLSVISIAGHGSLTVAMKTPRTFSRVEIKADLSADGGPFPKGLTLSADAAATLGVGEETYSLDLSRGGQHLATVLARFPEAANEFAGTWKVDLQDSNFALFAPECPLPHFTATGDGQFNSDTAFNRVHARGRLSATVSHLGVLAPALERFGAVTLAAGFDAVRSGHSIRVEHLSVSLPGTGPTAVVQSLQAFDFEEETGALKPADPAGDWAEISIRRIPAAWLSSLVDGLAWSGGDAAGDFVVRAEKGGFAFRPKAPLTAAGVSVEHAGRTFGRKLDLSVSLLANVSPQKWQVRLAPLEVASGGNRLATVEARVSSAAGMNQPIAVEGTWNADLQTQAAKAAVPDLSWIRGRSVSGDFTAKVGASTELDGKLAVVGHDEHHAVTASLHVEMDGGGRISFLAPVKIAFGSDVSDLSAEGTRIRDDAGTRLYLKLSGKSIFLEHLGLLAVPLAAGGGTPLAALAGSEALAGVRDRIPFWGDWTGHVAVAFDRLKTGVEVFDNVGGLLHVDQGSVHLEGGHVGIAGKRDVRVEGSVSFDAAAEFPYNLQATASLDRVDAESLFAAADSRKEPTIEGRFSLAGTLAGHGVNLKDLVGHTQEEFRLASTAGIVRVLKTDVDEALPPEPKARVSDALDTVGSAVGKFFGVEDKMGSGRRTVNPTTEAVIDFTNELAEIGFDEITVTGVRGIDGTIRLVKVAMTAPDMRLTGSGQVTYVKGLSLRTQPLSVDLQFWARGRTAKLLSTAGLLSTQKDDTGYTMLREPIHLGGTIEHLDTSRWHEMLVKAAQNPGTPKKGPEGSSR